MLGGLTSTMEVQEEMLDALEDGSPVTTLDHHDQRSIPTIKFLSRSHRIIH